MARSFLTAVNLNKNELQNAAVQNLGAAPSSPVKGQLYYDTAANILYWWDGTAWQSAKAGAGFPGYGSVPAETTFGIAKNDGVATTVARSDHTHGSPTHDAAAHSAIPLSALAVPTTDLNLNGKLITNLGSPSATTDAANKAYVDNAIVGLSWKAPVRVVSVSNRALTGTGTIDGVAIVAGDRVLLTAQTAPAENGIYVVASGAWARATDNDTAAEMVNAACFASEGATYADTAWVCTTNAPITIGTTGLAWVQFAGGGAITAGAGMTQSGNTLNVIAADGSLTVNADNMAVAYAGSGGNNGTAVTAARSNHLHTGIYGRPQEFDSSAGTSTVCTHNYNTKILIVQVHRKTAPFDVVEADIELTDNNTVTVRFASAVTFAEHSIIIIG